MENAEIFRSQMVKSFEVVHFILFKIGQKNICYIVNIELQLQVRTFFHVFE